MNTGRLLILSSTFLCHAEHSEASHATNKFFVNSNMRTEGYHVYHVYIITNQHKSVLYTGVTNYLARRLHEHNHNILEKKKTFASKYNCRHLLYYEKFTWVQEAIAREKEIKGWKREKKIDLIKTINPKLNFLEYLFPFEQ